MIIDLQPRVVELGKIKIGKKSDQERQGRNGTWRAPEKLDHFLVTTLERDALGDLKVDDRLMKQLAVEQKCDVKSVRELPIVLLSDDIEEVFPTQYVAYAGRSCVARSDGATITWLADPKNNWSPLKEPRVVENVNRFVQTTMVGAGDKATRLFKPHGTLNCVISASDARWGGVYKLRTTSIITIEQIYSGLLHVQQLTRGFLRNVPLRLVVRPMQVSPQGKATTVYVVHLELRGSDLTAIQREVIAAAQLEVRTGRELVAARSEYLRLLAAPGTDESEDEQAEIAEEFHPETVDVPALPPAPTDEPQEDEPEVEAPAPPAPKAARLPPPPRAAKAPSKPAPASAPGKPAAPSAAPSPAPVAIDLTF